MKTPCAHTGPLLCRARGAGAGISCSWWVTRFSRATKYDADAIRAYDYEIDVGIGCVREQRVGDVEVAVVDALDFHFKSVTREVLAHIGAFDLILLAAFVGDDDYLDESCRSSSGIASAIARAAARLPSQHTMTRSSLSGAFWMKGTNDDRPARIEQGGFDDLFFNRTPLGFGLPDNGEIEAPCNTAELVASASEIRARRERL